MLIYEKEDANPFDAPGVLPNLVLSMSLSYLYACTVVIMHLIVPLILNVLSNLGTLQLVSVWPRLSYLVTTRLYLLATT